MFVLTLLKEIDFFLKTSAQKLSYLFHQIDYFGYFADTWPSHMIQNACTAVTFLHSCYNYRLQSVLLGFYLVSRHTVGHTVNVKWKESVFFSIMQTIKTTVCFCIQPHYLMEVIIAANMFWNVLGNQLFTSRDWNYYYLLSQDRHKRSSFWFTLTCEYV